MSEVTKEDFNQIEQKLASIEQKIGNKWTLPIVVAVISGLIGMATVTMQVKLEGQRAEQAAFRDKALAADEDERKERKAYHDQIQALAIDVRKHYRGQCSGTESKEDQLDAALEQLRDLAEVKRSMYGEQLANSMQEYGDWVAESLYGPNRANCATGNDLKFQAVNSALQDFYEHRCRIQTPERQQALLGVF